MGFINEQQLRSKIQKLEEVMEELDIAGIQSQEEHEEYLSAEQMIEIYKRDISNLNKMKEGQGK